jgi:hypothetical protein
MMQVLVDKAEEQFQKFIAEAQQILGPTRWEIGRIASEIKEVCGKSDAEIGDAIGLSKVQVYQRRSVWDRFGGGNINFRLSWSHFCAALSWEDADTALQWAHDNEANVAEMTAWRRAQNGEDITKPAAVSLPELPDEHIPRPPSLAVPREETRKRSGDPETPNIVAAAPAAAAPHHIDDAPAAAKQKPKEHPKEDAKTRLLYAMREIMQVVTEIEDRKAVARKFRALADELDPPLDPPKVTGKFVPPSVEDVAEYCEAKGWPLDAQKFVDFYQSKGWKVGRVSMKDWRAAVGNAYRSADKWCHKQKADGRTRERDWSGAGW